MSDFNILPRASRKLAHGTKCECGTCGAPGTWDDMKHGKNGEAVFKDAAWYNPHEKAIECYECWLK